MTAPPASPGRRARPSAKASIGRGAPPSRPDLGSRSRLVSWASQMISANVRAVVFAQRVRVQWIASWIRGRLTSAFLRGAPVCTIRVSCGTRATTALVRARMCRGIGVVRIMIWATRAICRVAPPDVERRTFVSVHAAGRIVRSWKRRCGVVFGRPARQTDSSTCRNVSVGPRALVPCSPIGTPVSGGFG